MTQERRRSLLTQQQTGVICCCCFSSCDNREIQQRPCKHVVWKKSNQCPAQFPQNLKYSCRVVTNQMPHMIPTF